MRENYTEHFDPRGPIEEKINSGSLREEINKLNEGVLHDVLVDAMKQAMEASTAHQNIRNHFGKDSIEAKTMDQLLADAGKLAEAIGKFKVKHQILNLALFVTNESLKSIVEQYEKEADNDKMLKHIKDLSEVVSSHFDNKDVQTEDE
jgi:hypothetical protein